MKIYDKVSHADMDESLGVVDRILATDPVYCPIASSAVGSVESARGTVSSQRGTLDISSSTIKSDVTKLRRAMDNLITVDPIFVRSDLADETDAAIKQATDNLNASTAKADSDDQYADGIVTAAKERLKRYCS
jgi:ABC-type phosphate/phosphonate transport system substrate-binding protein